MKTYGNTAERRVNGTSHSAPNGTAVPLDLDERPSIGESRAVELVTTGLVDLSDVSLANLLSCDATALQFSTLQVLGQLDRPRVNLGGGGPPGRVD
jgi:hypothetical protein